MLFSTVFLFALSMSRSGSVPVGVQLEKSMLPVFGRPLTAKSDTQSSEHGLVTTRAHHRVDSSRSSVERNIWFLGNPDPMKQHGKLSGNCNDGPIACLLASTRCQLQAPLS
jgi:hypothetical protein